MNTSISMNLRSKNVVITREAFFIVVLAFALIAFEIFNYSTTEYALTDLLGDLHFFGFSWATILSLAFCGIDFAGLAKLFSNRNIEKEIENLYLFGSWLIAAVMNAVLTWWGVSVAILSHGNIENPLISQGSLLTFVPILVAVIVWLTRVMIIGAFSNSKSLIIEKRSK